MRLSAAVRVLAPLAVVSTLAVSTAAALPSAGAGSGRRGPVVAAGPTTDPAPGPLRARLINATPAIPRSARRVVLYGDSLAWEAQGPFTDALAAAGITQVTTRTFGGTAICDWFSQMRTDAATIHPDAVVVEFSGNALTPCMKALDGSSLDTETYFAKYLQDARTVLSIFSPAATVYLAGSPITLRATLRHDPNAGRLNWIYAALSVTTPNTRYIDAGAVVLLDGHWTHTLPCLPGEPCTGGTDAHGTPVNVVRAPDGGHFCPIAPPAVRGVIAGCHVYSSGAHRYGTAMADPVIRSF
jgi:hypothetical protein